MTNPTTAGHVTGAITLTIPGADPIDLGTVRLPLRLTRVEASARGGYMSFGLGVDLEAVMVGIRQVFNACEVSDDD